MMNQTPLTIVIHPDANREIAAQTLYFAKKASARVAARWERLVLQTIRSLTTLPTRGSPVPVSNAALHGLRRLPVEGFPNHLIFYRPDLMAATVVILHMFHGARDLETMLEAEGLDD